MDKQFCILRLYIYIYLIPIYSDFTEQSSLLYTPYSLKTEYFSSVLTCELTVVDFYRFHIDSCYWNIALRDMLLPVFDELYFFFSDILSSGKICIRTRRKIIGADNMSHCRPCHYFLHLRRKKSNGRLL